MKPAALNLLQDTGLPIVYRAEGPPPAGLPDRDDSFPVVCRTDVRSLTVMQKEATVTTSRSPLRWRLASDEGPYLGGHDSAPAPLAYMTAGLASDLMVSIRAAMTRADVKTEFRLTLDARFTMEGSMRARTMTGGALDPEITVAVSSPGPGLEEAVRQGVDVSVSAALMSPVHRSRFSLTNHGHKVLLDPPDGEDLAALADPGAEPEFPQPKELAELVVVKTRAASPRATREAGVSLQETQSRQLHLRADARAREDGVVSVEVHLLSPEGSTFRFLADEPRGPGGASRAPDPLTYVSAGLGFCFMTQIGRFAKIVKQELGPYHIVQDTRFSPGDADRPPRAAAPTTHVYLAVDGGDDFAREAVAMSEQTCFLHALCRTPLEPQVQVVRS